MSQLRPITPTGVVSAANAAKVARPVSRDVMQIQAEAVVRASRIDAEARLAELKVSTVTGVARTGQMDVTLLVAAGNQLVLANPGASGAIDLINQVAITSVASIVADTATSTRRL